MKRPKPRIQLPSRDADNDGRCLDPSPDARLLARLVVAARYECYAKHKAAPHAYGLRPYSGPKGDYTRCDEHANFGITKMASIPRMLRRGIKAGLVGPSARLIWTVGDDGWIFEGRITNVGQDVYHGYPVRPTEAIADPVYRRFCRWAAEEGDDADQKAATRCRVMYGFQP